MFFVDLISKGGPVLYLLFLLTFLILFIVINKYFFIFLDKKYWFDSRFIEYTQTNPANETNLSYVENTFIAEFKRESLSNTKLLDGLIGMCPMLGLLGTVYGMIEVFEVLSFLGTGNPRAMSSGVAKATIPTMASMVITLFGLFFRQDIAARIQKTEFDLRLLFKNKGYIY